MLLAIFFPDFGAQKHGPCHHARTSPPLKEGRSAPHALCPLPALLAKQLSEIPNASLRKSLRYCEREVSVAEGSIRQRPLLRGRAGVAGVPSPGHASTGSAQELTRAPHLFPHHRGTPLAWVGRYVPQGSTGGDTKGWLSSLTTPYYRGRWGTAGLPVRERPRYPLEGRGKQAYVSVEGNITETQNSNLYVHRTSTD